MLFDINDIGKSQEDKFTFSHALNDSKPDIINVACKAKDLAMLVIDDLKPNVHIDFHTAGELSIHQLIRAFVNLYPSTVFISSWALKEEPARALLFLREQGKIKELYGVFDYRIKTLDAQHFHLIEKAMSTYRLTKNHAKVVVMINETLSCCIVSSANLSNNPRNEAGFISTCEPTINFHKTCLQNLLDGKSIY